MNPIHAIVFDLYGTLYDVHSVADLCEHAFPGSGLKLSELWRQKQLEYTWLRSVMGDYRHFEEITEDALRYSCAKLGLPLAADTHELLSTAYLRLAPHPDTSAALARLFQAQVPMGIVSNGSRMSIHNVVHHSGLEWAFSELVSVEDLAVFKPHAAVYALAEQRMRQPRANILFVSSNAWDVAAAGFFGFKTCWSNRQSAPFEQLGAAPTHTVANLQQMADWVLQSDKFLRNAVRERSASAT